MRGTMKRARLPAAMSICLAAGCLAVIQSASAQTAPDQSEDAEESETRDETQEKIAEIDAVVVTAQRRNQSLQSVPIAVTAMTADQLIDSGLRDIGSLEAAVPGLTVSHNGSTSSPFIRGVGTNNNVFNSEPSVATYVDGVYVASNIGALFSFNNIERIEVLKGPQGTLFGRNATGGVIQVVTKDPSHDASAEFNIGYGNYDTASSSAYMTGGLGQDLAADIAIYQKNQGEGYGRNLFTGDEIHKRDEFAARTKWLYTPGDKTEVRFTLDYTHMKGAGEAQQIAPGAVSADGSLYPGRYNAELNGGFLDDKVWGSSLKIDHDFDFARLVSISAINDIDRRAYQDVDVTRLPITESETTAAMRSYSQELQLLAPADSKVDWVLGAYYLNAKYEYSPLHIFGTSLAPLDGVDIYSQQGTESVSVYGQATYPITQRLNATAGLRYTWEQQDISGTTVTAFGNVVVPEHDEKTNEPTWRASLDYSFSDSVLGYVSYNRGLKSGGFNLLAPQGDAYQPEILDALEVGVKSTLFDRRLRLNASAFYYDYQDMQINVLTGPSVQVLNAAAAKIRGIDADIQLALSANLTISGGFGFYDTEYTDYPNAVSYGPNPGPPSPIDATGNKLVNAPDFTGSVMATYRVPTNIGEFVFNGAVVRNDGYYASASNRIAYPGYTLLNSSVVWNSLDERFAIRLWANNLTDAEYLSVYQDSGNGDKQVEAAPRTFGVTFTARF